MISFDLQQSIPGMVNDNYVTAQAASDLTGYNIQSAAYATQANSRQSILAVHG